MARTKKTARRVQLAHMPSVEHQSFSGNSMAHKLYKVGSNLLLVATHGEIYLINTNEKIDKKRKELILKEETGE